MSFRAQGQKAAELGRRVLMGEKPENIPVVYEGTNFYLFDWRQLKKWGLPETALPPGSEVRFKSLSAWELYRWHIVGLVAIIFIQGVMIAFLTINRRKRRQAEQNYRTMADFTHDWEYWANPDDTLKYVSPSCERISGYRAEEFLAHPDLLREIVVAEDQTLWHCHHQDVHQGMQTGELRFRIGRKGRLRRPGQPSPKCGRREVRTTSWPTKTAMPTNVTIRATISSARGTSG
jgi:PAS domain-containing protein